MNFYVPATATSAEVEIYDEDKLTREGSSRDDLIGRLDVLLPGSSRPICSLASAHANGCTFTMDISTTKAGWWGRIETVTAGTVSGSLVAGDVGARRAAAINAAGVEMIEAWTPVLDANSASSYFDSIKYSAGQLRYLIGGMLLDDAGQPGSGIWKNVESRAFDGKRLATGPGADTTSLIGNAYVREAMGNLGANLQSNDRFRRNELGIQFMNGVIWPEKPNRAIGLADNAIDHARARPLLDKIVGPAMAQMAETKKQISELAESFWFATSVDTDLNVQVFTQTLLHKFMLGLVLSRAEAEEFVSYKSKILIVAGGPPSVVCITYDCDDINRWKAAKLVKYQAALEAFKPAQTAELSALEKTKLASAMLDALLFAGGVSIPTVVKNAFAVLYGEYGKGQLGADFELKESQLLPFVLEVVRRFPPVSGFPSWDRATNNHVMIDLLMANLDQREDGWGPTARDFKLRSLSEYHQKHVGWADQAIVNGDNGHAFSRVCPAKDLSVVMVTEFLRSFLRHGGQRCWHTTQAPSSISINGYGADVVQLSYACSSTGSLFSSDKLTSAQALLGVAKPTGFARLWSGLLSQAPDMRIDAYTRLLAMVNRDVVEKAITPTAADVTVPTSMQDVPSILCGLTNISVPATDEHQGDIQGLIRFANTVGDMLSFPESADDCGDWAANEDPEAQVKSMVGPWPVIREMYNWGTERYTDAALEDLVLRGMGQHRLQRVLENDTSAPVSAKYAVYLNFAAALEVRPGFATLGADAYFSKLGKLVGIARGGQLFTPDGEPGSPPSCTQHWLFGSWRRSCTPAVIGWKHAKLAFRGTLLAVITAIDHLYDAHLTSANALVTANVEELPPNHPLRRLMTPFGFRSEAINFNAAVVLVPEHGMLHRGTPFTTHGLTQLFNYANSTSKGIAWQTIPDKRIARNIDPDDLELPYDIDGSDYYEILQNYTHSYLAHHFDLSAMPDACAADPDVARWFARVDSLLPAVSDLPELNCKVLEDVLATFMYHVSAYHRHVGTIAAEAADPCFGPTAWREGELCGPPRTSFMQGLIMATTGLEMPKIIEDYTHMFEGEKPKQMWRDLTERLHALGVKVDQRNTKRRRPFTVFDSKSIETAIGI